jgi:hypothetical protein
MGAYSGTSQASMSLLSEGNAADCDNDGDIDANDLAMLLDLWLHEEVLIREDIDRDGVVDFFEFAELTGHWFWAQQP